MLSPDSEESRKQFEAWAKEYIDYWPDTGILTWKKKPNRNIPLGRQIGKANIWGHMAFATNGKTYMVHRVIWLLHYGKWPEHQIDHINGNKSDNRITNLRDVTQFINMQNQKVSHKNNKSGYLGVHWSKHVPTKPWKAEIKINGKSKSIGHFATPEEAHAAYLQAKSQLHIGYAP
jgi:hypothetical protein